MLAQLCLIDAFSYVSDSITGGPAGLRWLDRSPGSVSRLGACCCALRRARGRTISRLSSTFPSSSRQQLVTTQHSSSRNVFTAPRFGSVRTLRILLRLAATCHMVKTGLSRRSALRARGLRPLLTSQQRRDQRKRA